MGLLLLFGQGAPGPGGDGTPIGLLLALTVTGQAPPEPPEPTPEPPPDTGGTGGAGLTSGVRRGSGRLVRDFGPRLRAKLKRELEEDEEAALVAAQLPSAPPQNTVNPSPYSAAQPSAALLSRLAALDLDQSPQVIEDRLQALVKQYLEDEEAALIAILLAI